MTFDMHPGSLDTVKIVSEIVSNAVTIGAIVVGAIWAYWGFLRERTRWPKATLELVVDHRQLTSAKALLHVKVKIHNAGRGLMKLSELRVDVYRVLPVDEPVRKRIEAGCLVPEGKVKAKWPVIDQAKRKWNAADPALGTEPELEPGENDEFGSDFIVSAREETVFVYVYVRNIAKKGGSKLGWTMTTFYDLTGASGGDAVVNLVAQEAQ